MRFIVELQSRFELMSYSELLSCMSFSFMSMETMIKEESPFVQVAGMWSDFFSSLMQPPGGIERDRMSRYAQAQLTRLTNLQLQHQQLQLQQLHLLLKQHRIQAAQSGHLDTPTPGSPSSAENSLPPSALSPALAQALKSAQSNSPGASPGGLPALPLPVWHSFQSLQAQQWGEALQLAKGQRGLGATAGVSAGVEDTNFQDRTNSPNPFAGVLGTQIGGKRCKAYPAPKGVWKNNGGFNATIYVHKRRIYGPIRRELSDAIEDRREMEEALKDLMNGAIADNPAALEYEMREVVGRLRNKVRVKSEGGEMVVMEGDEQQYFLHGGLHMDEGQMMLGHHNLSSHTHHHVIEDTNEFRNPQKRMRIGSGFSALGSPQHSPCINWSGIDFAGNPDPLTLSAPRFEEEWGDEWGTSKGWGDDAFVRH